MSLIFHFKSIKINIEFEEKKSPNYHDQLKSQNLQSLYNYEKAMKRKIKNVSLQRLPSSSCSTTSLNFFLYYPFSFRSTARLVFTTKLTRALAKWQPHMYIHTYSHIAKCIYVQQRSPSFYNSSISPKYVMHDVQMDGCYERTSIKQSRKLDQPQRSFTRQGGG